MTLLSAACKSSFDVDFIVSKLRSIFRFNLIPIRVEEINSRQCNFKK